MKQVGLYISTVMPGFIYLFLYQLEIWITESLLESLLTGRVCVTLAFSAQQLIKLQVPYSYVQSYTLNPIFIYKSFAALGNVVLCLDYYYDKKVSTRK